MSQYSLLDRRPEETVFPLLKEKNIGVLVRGALAQAILVNKPAREYLGHQPEEVKKAAEAIQKVSSKRTAAQSAIQFVLQHPAVTSAVVGMRTIEQLKEIVETTSSPKITDEEYEYLLHTVNANVYDVYR